MKKILYFVLMGVGLLVTHSCKDLLEEDGNPLLGETIPGEGITGKRALYREITDFDTLAEYRYNGLLLNEVVESNERFTKISYSGTKITKIDYNGRVTDNDSIVYSRLFTYGIQGRISTITETSERWAIDTTDPVDPPTLGEKAKTIYEFKYDAHPTKMSSILMKKGVEQAGIPFTYATYSDFIFTYDQRENITKLERLDGDIDPVDGSLVRNGQYFIVDYANYDNGLSPFTLLPWDYKVSAVLSNPSYAYKLSNNNPKKMTYDSDILPSPTILTSDLVYDPQFYLKNSFMINYFYKPL